MTSKFVGTLMLIVIAACVATGIIVYPHLPVHFISHWGVSGHPNGSMSRIWGTFLLPAIMLILYGVWAGLPALDPLDEGLKKSRKVYDFIWFLIIAFFAYVYALMLFANLGVAFPFLRALMPALALLIFLLGTLMPYLHRNWFAGIRTPWSLYSDTAWKKTHEFGGKLFQIAGVIILLSAFFNPALTISLVVWPLVGAVLFSVIYSYRVYKHERKS